MASPQSQASLSALPAHQQSDTALTAHIASRYHVQCPVSYLSTSALVAVNTYTSSSRGPNGNKEGSAMGAAEDLANRTITRLGQRQENQAILFLGESGSGKTTIRSHFLSAALGLSATPLSKKVSFASFAVDSLTTTKTATTPTASKAGLFFELQYNTSSSSYPTLIGGKVLDHRLERSRVTSVPSGERNFHVLYYLLAGTSPAEKEHLGLDLPGTRLTADGGDHRMSAMSSQKRWRYLGHPSQLKIGVNDVEGFQHFKTALRKLEFPREDIAHMCEMLAAILHIGQLEFQSSQSTTPAADESGGYGHEGGEEVTTVKNKDVMSVIAAFLGVPESHFEQCMGYRTQTLHRDRVTIMLDPKGARENADELARTLYALLVALIVEKINQKICAEDESIKNTLSIVDFPGFAVDKPTHSTLDQLLNNAACESFYNFCLQSFFERKADLLETEEVHVPATSYFDNSDAVKGLLKPGNGLLSILDDQMKRGKTDLQFLESVKRRFEGKNAAIEAESSTVLLPGTNFQTENTTAKFTVKHFAGEVDYPVAGLMESNGEVISGDLMNLVGSSSNSFVRELFGQEALNKVTHPKDRSAVTQASVASKPMRMPSMARKKGERPGRLGTRRDEGAKDEKDGGRSFSGNNKSSGDSQPGAAAQFLSSLDNISKSLTSPNTNSFFVFCLKPNDRRIANQFDSKCVRTQMQTLGVAEISQRLKNADFSIFMPFGEFLGTTEGEVSVVGTEKEKAEMILDEKSWPGNEARVGATGVFLSERCWRQVAGMGELGPAPNPFDDETPRSDSNYLAPGDAKTGFGESHVNLMNTPGSGNYYDDKAAGYFGSRDLDGKSEAGGSAFKEGDMFRNLDTRSQLAEKGNDIKMAEIEEQPTTAQRKRWLVIVYMLTCWCPDFAVRLIGRMPRKDIRMAWREKLAINIIIWFSCLAIIFLMLGMPALICPRQDVMTPQELSTKNGDDGADELVAIRGEIFNLEAFKNVHYPDVVPNSALEKYAGKDATNLFPVQVSALCEGTGDQGIDPAVQLNYKDYNYTDASGLATGTDDPNAQYHDFRWATNDPRADWFEEQMIYLKGTFWKASVGYTPKYIKKLSEKDGSAIGYIHGDVYDFTDYAKGGRSPQYPPGTDRPDDDLPDSNFMNQDVVNLFTQRSGQDVSQYWDALNLGDPERARMERCMNNLFRVGNVDTRNGPKCKFATYFLLAMSIVIVTIIGFKFLAALQFSRKNVPEDLDKFIICTVPAYTEDEDSLRRAIDSAARMKYDDKRKLMFIICDGVIIGQGNDRSTPRIVLDILGVPETVDPEPLSFESLGEGQKQHNMGKIYSGLYEVQGHIVPFIVLVKVGKPSEVSKPGNRGKRDSQMVLMRFLNRVHYNLAMTPMELELVHQIRNVIGVNPTFYEYLLQIDADTVVAPDAATRFVAAFLHDTKLIGVCGETALSNAKSSFITMIQVYEYYISHNLIKAFESLFGSVTCLPGCFTMYRIRTADSGKPLFVSKEVVEDYSEIRVDTLHSKNLLHLGEDRYLTTLLLKHHPKSKTKYIMRAHAWTVAPTAWNVFMSQRRRWINSTVHNLIELIPLQQLCGFCCFSMRFIVFVDLISTVVQPVILVYLAYLFFLVGSSSQVVPFTAFILLAAIYGLQAIIFIVRRKWEMIGWMLVYILATPVFSFGLPLYSFWHMDDFSWGNTRMVTGEKGKQVIVTDEGKFDPASIPKKRWDEYTNELWEAQESATLHTGDDARSEITGVSYATKYHSQQWGAAPSEYGYPPSRPMSQLGMPPPMTYPYGQQQRSGSRMSLAASEAGAGTPMLPRDFSGSDLDLSDLPSDDAILSEIREILRTADLMTVTKKSIKAELERRFGVGLEGKRVYIGSATEAILGGQL